MHRAKLFGRCEATTGIAPSERLLAHVMRQEPYRSAHAVGDEVIEGAKHRPPQTTRARLRGDFIRRRANLRGWEDQVDWAYVRTMGPESETVLCQDPFLAYDERVERLAA